MLFEIVCVVATLTYTCTLSSSCHTNINRNKHNINKHHEHSSICITPTFKKQLPYSIHKCAHLTRISTTNIPAHPLSATASLSLFSLSSLSCPHLCLKSFRSAELAWTTPCVWVTEGENDNRVDTKPIEGGTCVPVQLNAHLHPNDMS